MEEKRQEDYLALILNDEKLYERFGALCCMDIMEKFTPLSDCHDYEYIYSMDGMAFAEDGAGGYYILLDDGSIGYVNFAENECGRVAETLKDLFELELNCAYSWHNYLLEEFFGMSPFPEELVKSAEVKGREEFEDVYGDEMPSYDELRREIAEKLRLDISPDITKDILPKLYRAVMRKPEFTALSKEDNAPVSKLYG